MGLLYSKLKVFRFPDKLNSLLPDQPATAPLHIRLKPTNVCNHNCWYCAYRKEGMQLGKDMRIQDQIPREKMFEIADDIVNMGVKAVTFSGGGEPFCYPHLLETARRLHDGGVKIASLTNGSRLTGETAAFFARNATWVRISMDGWNDESYVRYRSVADGEFTKIIDNIRAFKRLDGNCYLGISYIIDKDNYSHISEVLQIFKNIGVDSVKLSCCIVADSAAENNAYHAEFFDRAKDAVLHAKATFEDENFEISDAYHDMDDRFGKSYSWCPYLQINPVIGADQNVYACRDKAYNLDDGLLGTLRDKSFKEFWFGDKRQFYRINPSKLCRHHCCVNDNNRLIWEYLNIDEGHVKFV